MKQGRKPQLPENVHGWREAVAARRKSIDVEKPAKPPSCPRRLEGKAREYWKEVARPLHAAGMLAFLDIVVVALLCQLLAERDELTEQIDGKLLIAWESGERLNPLLRQKNEVDAQIRRLCNDMGMTQTARISISVAPKAGAKLRENSRFPKG